jgi:hypothetical protein
VKKWLEKKAYHFRRAFLPEVVWLSLRKVGYAASLLARGQVALPIFRSSSPNLTFVLHARGGRRKLYEIDGDPRVFEAAYALFEGGLLPRLFPFAGRLVCAEWVAGRPLSAFPAAEQAGQLGRILAALHARCPAECPAGFPHLARLLRRYDAHRGALPADARAAADALRDRVANGCAALAPSLAPSCVHPDLIAANVIVAARGPVVVDNEFFGAGAGREFDVINSMYALTPDVRASFLAAYEESMPLASFHAHRRLWEELHRFKRLSRAMRFRYRRGIAEALAPAV